MSAPVEVPAFQRVNGDAVFTVLHWPSGAVRGGFLFCHPLGEEKLWAHRVFVSYARELAAQGWAVLRLDFRGEGDSDRAFEETDLNTRLEDAHTGLQALRRELPREAPVGLLGLRFGASIAALTAAQGRVHRLVLWDPVLDGMAYMQSVLMTNLAAQMAAHRKIVEDRKALVARLRRGASVNVEGYLLSPGLFEQACAIDIKSAIREFDGDGLVVQIDPGAARPRQDLVELTALSARLDFTQVQEQPFWKETKSYHWRAARLAAATSGWLHGAA